MLTINSEVSEAKLTDLKPGELFHYSGSQGNFLAMVVQNEPQHYANWIRLTGKDKFRMNDLGSPDSESYVHAPTVLRLGIRHDALRFRIDHNRLKRGNNVHAIGTLVIDDQPRIVTRFGQGELDARNAWAVSLTDFSRNSPIDWGAYFCDTWQLVYAPAGADVEIIAECAPSKSATVTTLSL